MGIEGPHLFRIDTGEEFPLAGTQVIGRSDSCNFVIQVGTISGRHASITVNGATALLQDLGSTNGTYVQEKRIQQAAQLQDGARFRLHCLEFEFRAARRLEALTEGARGGDTTEVARDTAPRPLPLPVGWDAVQVPTLYFAQGPRELGPMSGTRQQWTIGRGPDRTLRIDDQRVSTKHAKIVREGDMWKVMDQLSMNRTWVNERLVASAFLQSRDRLAFGPVACIFLLPRSSP